MQLSGGIQVAVINFFASVLKIHVVSSPKKSVSFHAVHNKTVLLERGKHFLLAYFDDQKDKGSLSVVIIPG